jgi:hypothetical protein
LQQSADSQLDFLLLLQQVRWSISLLMPLLLLLELLLLLRCLLPQPGPIPAALLL